MVVIAFLAVGAIGALIDRTVLSPTNIAMPSLVGIRLDKAHDRLDDLKITEVDDQDAFEDRVILLDSNWTVVRQQPQAGTLVNRQVSVTLNAGKTDDDNTSVALGKTPAAQSATTDPAPTSSSTPTTSAAPTPTVSVPTMPAEAVAFAAWWVGDTETHFAAFTASLQAASASGAQVPSDIVPFCRAFGDATLAASADLPSPDNDVNEALGLAYAAAASGADNCIKGSLILARGDLDLVTEQLTQADARLRELLTEAGVTPP